MIDHRNGADVFRSVIFMLDIAVDLNGYQTIAFRLGSDARSEWLPHQSVEAKSLSAAANREELIRKASRAAGEDNPKSLRRVTIDKALLWRLQGWRRGSDGSSIHSENE